METTLDELIVKLKEIRQYTNGSTPVRLYNGDERFSVIPIADQDDNDEDEVYLCAGNKLNWV